MAGLVEPAQKWLEGESISANPLIGFVEQEARSHKKNNVFGNWILGFAKICKDTRFSPAKENINMTKRCQQCCSEFDVASTDCPICGHLDLKISGTGYGGIIKCWVRRKCFECQTVCYERYCPICGERTKSDRPTPNKERESLTWQSTSLRVRTPTGITFTQSVRPLYRSHTARRFAGARQVTVPMLRSVEVGDGASSEPPRSSTLPPPLSAPAQQPPPSSPWTSAVAAGRAGVPTVPYPIARTPAGARLAATEAAAAEAEAEAAEEVEPRLVWAEFPNPCGFKRAEGAHGAARLRCA
jgi:hypothetical protein